MAENGIDKATIVVGDKVNSILGGIVGIEPIGPGYPDSDIVDQPSFDRGQYQRLDPDQVIS